jgi:hypothetical protein
VAIPSSRPVQVESDPESDPEPEPRPELKVLGDKGKGRTLPTSDAAPTPPIAIDSDSDSESDDGITFLGSSAATRPAIPVVELDDDSDDDRPSVKPEAKPDVKPTRPQPKLTRPPHVEAWLTMPLADRQRAVKHERDAVRSLRPYVVIGFPANFRTDPVLNATIRHRKNELKMVERSFGIRQWVPPTHSILRILPRDAVHSKLRDTFPWPVGISCDHS